jgi:hypothetical protein
LGINTWKDELEDRSFAIVDPKEYQATKHILDEELSKKEHGVKVLQKEIGHVLKTEGVKFLDITGRTKRVYSLYKKLKKYHGDLDKVSDIVALRVITRASGDCYGALGAIHQHFQPVPGRIKDFIATPKPNGYQSLHTTVFDRKGSVFEIQIRTDLMHEEADRGVAAHWFYSQSGKVSQRLDNKFGWINELRSWQDDDQSGEEFMESLKIDFFKDRIFVLTPKGDAKDLPVGATVIDFAFSVHTDLGFYMMGAKINGKFDVQVLLLNSSTGNYETQESYSDLDFTDPTSAFFFPDVMNELSNYVNVVEPGGNEGPLQLNGIARTQCVAGGDESAGGQTIQVSLVGTPIATRTFFLTYTDTTGTVQTVTDNGAGQLIGAIDITGTNTINYVTGALNVKLLAPIKVGTLVTTVYRIVPAETTHLEQFGDTTKGYVAGSDGEG